VLSSQFVFPPPPRLRRDLAEALRAKAGVFGSGFVVLEFLFACVRECGLRVAHFEPNLELRSAHLEPNLEDEPGSENPEV
jgi:hypothetical protein